MTKQLEALPFYRRSINKHGYNPSLIRFGDRLLMAYRYHYDAGWQTRLAMAELDSKWAVIGNKEIIVESQQSSEDAHLFVHQGQLWMSWTESESWGKSVVKYGQLVESKQWMVPTRFQPNYGRNNGKAMEKGWVPYSQNNEILFIYSAMPDHIVIKAAGNDKPTAILQPPLKHWPWGIIKGGTAWLPHGDDFIRFFHSTLDNESNVNSVNNPNRRYYIGVMSRSKLASKPLLYGSEDSEMTETERSACRSYKGNVVFVSGAITLPDGSFAICVGINDSETAILRAKPDDLHL